SGHDGLLAVFPPADAAKEPRLTELVRRARLTFSVDSMEGVARVESIAQVSGRPVGYYWEVDTGTARGGTLPEDTVTAVLAAQAAHTGARFEGMMSFGGHIYTSPDMPTVDVAAKRDSDIMGQVAMGLAAL